MIQISLTRKIKLKENKMAIVRQINGEMNNDYVKHLQVIELEAILKDLYIPDYIKEDLLEEGFLEDYHGGEYEVVVVQYDYNKVAVALNSFPSDPSKYVSSTDGGTLFVSSRLPSIDYEDGTYYAGGEILEVGTKEPYESKTRWSYNSLSEVNHFLNLPISKDTMERIVGRLSGE
jgi:hypothetical protein